MRQVYVERLKPAGGCTKATTTESAEPLQVFAPIRFCTPSGFAQRLVKCVTRACRWRPWAEISERIQRTCGLLC
jgi:hypothetical protein